MHQYPRLCLNMIVRNEAAIIERALQSVVGMVQCCVICDTGSTDATTAIIQAFCDVNDIACELHTIAFIDFSQARNAALARARCSPLAYDYLLLLDADMELRVGDRAALQALQADAALIRQENASIAYQNVRLLRRGADAIYVGATHEALVVKGEIAQMEGLYFFDHADGANRPEKLERDERLLRADLQQDPHAARSMFYLAQTLQDAGRYAEAIEWYTRRVEASGWEEECWYARYQVAICRQKQGDVAGFVSVCLEAYAFRPSRAEPLVRAARHYADSGLHDAALLMLEQASSIPWPCADRLFVERAAYGDAILELISISGYYSALDKRRVAGRHNCDALAIAAGSEPHRRWTARSNLFYYAQPLQALCPEVQLHAIDIAVPTHFMPTNPSFTRNDTGYQGVVRAVNYRIEGGCYKVVDNDDIRTRNHMVRLAADFSVMDVHEMKDHSTLPRFDTTKIQGFEDCRLFFWRDAWWCSATARDVSPDARATMVLLQLDKDNDIAQAFKLHGFADDQHQKNWMPIIDERLRFLYTCAPAIVLDASASDGSFVVDSMRDVGIACEHWRGGTPLIPWDSGYLTIVHESKDTPTGRLYLHRFVALDHECAPLATSETFYFRTPGIEFAAGLTRNHTGDRLVVSFGSEDSSAWLATLPEVAVLNMLQPVRTRS